MPVCLDPRPRLMCGIGDILSAPLDVPRLPAILVNPGVAVATKEVFAALRLEALSKPNQVPASALSRRYDVPREVLDRLAELGVLTPASRGYTPSDVKIVEAISRFRAGGYEERIGFTVYDTLRYKRALEALVAEEVQVLMERLAGEMDTDRAVALIDDGAEPLRDLIAALHQKLLVAELKRQRAARG